MEENNNQSLETNEKARQEWLKGKTKQELKKAYYWLLQKGKVTLSEYLNATVEKGRPNC